MDFSDQPDEISTSGVEITIDELVDNVRTRSSKMNQREIDQANWFLDEKQKAILGNKWRDELDYFCDNKPCKKTQRDIILDWEEKQIKRMKKGLPRQIRKIESWWIVNELSGRGINTYKKLPNGNLMMIPFGNINRLCRSCNYLYHTHKNHLPHNENTPQSVIISHDLRNGYVQRVNNMLVTERHVCKIATFNKISASLGGTQKTMRETFEQYYDVLYQTIDLDDFPKITCHYKFCDGEHIIKLGQPPETILTNIQAEEKEMAELAKKQGQPDELSN
jgi:hypothetical protein